MPLLLLLALVEYAAGAAQAIPCSEIDKPLQNLLVEFGPPRKSFHSEYPFWRLQNDGLRKLWNAESAEARKSNIDAKKSELMKHEVAGGLTVEIYNAVVESPALLGNGMLYMLRCFANGC